MPGTDEASDIVPLSLSLSLSHTHTLSLSRFLPCFLSFCILLVRTTLCILLVLLFLSVYLLDLPLQHCLP